MHRFSKLSSLLSYVMADQTCCQVCIFRCSCKPFLLQGRTTAQAIPAVLAGEQWEALGLRLRGIEDSMQVSAAAREPLIAVLLCAPHECSNAIQKRRSSMLTWTDLESNNTCMVVAACTAEESGLTLRTMTVIMEECISTPASVCPVFAGSM